MNGPSLKPETLKLLDENIRNISREGKNFLNRTSMAQEIAPSIKRLDYVKLQSFCTAKDTTNKAHRAHRKEEKSLKAMF